MDELAFRRRVYAYPQTTDSEVAEAANEDKAKQQFLQETRALDEQIQSAMNIPVPTDLADKLIWQSTMREHVREKRRARVHIAMAASVAFMVGLTFAMWTPGKLDLGDAALAHMHYSQAESPLVATPVTLDLVNQKLDSLGAMGTHISDSIGSIYTANFCTLEKMRSLHLIIDSENGPISVFFLPHSEDAKLPNSFSNDMYEGTGFSIQRARVMVVGNKHSDMDEMASRVKDSLIRT